MALRLGEEDIWEATALGITPRPRMSPLEFGEEHRVYSKEGRSSRWRSSETPWAPEILQALSDEHPARRVVCPKGTQLGFTELGLIWIGQGIVESQSALAIFPTDSVAKKVVKTKYRPMLMSTSILKGIFVGRSADSTLHFSAPGVDVMFSGSNSPTNFATVTVPRAFGDEVDRWSPELLDEGDPVDLLDNRIAEYGFLGKMFLPCSPTIEGASIVWREYLQTDMRVFECPCPSCGVKSQWVWENLDWTPGKPESVVLYCRAEGCGVGSTEYEWKSRWGEGAWRATNPNPVRADAVGFHLSTLYARFGQRTWAQLAQQYEAVKASGSAARMQTFWNTILGLPWKVSEDAVAVDTLRARLEDDMERGVCPGQVLLLTAGADYQKNRIEVFIWGWGRLWERWLVDKVVIERLTNEGKKRPAADIRAELNERVFDVAWPHALGGSLKIEMTLHDAADVPTDVFDIIDGLPSKKHVANKNTDGWGQVHRWAPPKVVDVRHNGKVVKTGRRLMRGHSAELKRDWYDDLGRPLAEDGPSERYVHFPAWVDEEDGLLEQFVAEEIRKSTRGKPYWHKLGRNEGLDCSILALGAHWQLKAHRWSAVEWSTREARVRQERPAAATTEKKPNNPPRRSRIRGRTV